MRPFRYVNWDPKIHGIERTTFEHLFDLFQQLLLLTAGDVAEALGWLTQLDERHELGDEHMGIGDFVEELKNRGFIESDTEGLVQMTPRTERSLRARSLKEIFRQIQKGGSGSHTMNHIGSGSDRMPETRAWQFGDDVHSLDITGTLSNAFRRWGLSDIRLTEDDFEVFETDHQMGQPSEAGIDATAMAVKMMPAIKINSLSHINEMPFLLISRQLQTMSTNDGRIAETPNT